MTEEPEKRDVAWSSDWDAKRDLLDVHNPRFKKVLGKDFKMVRWTEKEQEFIEDMVSVIIGLRSIHPKNTIYTKDGPKTYQNPVEEQTVSMFEHRIGAMTATHFNQEGNMIVDRVTGWQQPEQHEAEGAQTVMRKLKEAFSGGQPGGGMEGP